MATTTLGLTQFTGTDTMNPLTQYNADMTKIDDYAGATNTNIGTLASLKTAVKTSTVGAINEVYDTTDNGWISARATLTYASASTPTFVCNTSIDLTTRISVGMKIKLTQTTTKYFFVTAITSTTITLYGGTTYSVINSAISNVYYSVVKSPYGFPLNPDKWSTKVTASSSSTTGGNNSKWNPTGLSLNIPIGLWDISYKVSIQDGDSTSGPKVSYFGLSTSVTNVVGADFTETAVKVGNASSTSFTSAIFGRFVLSLDTPKTIYAIIISVDALRSVYLLGDVYPYIKATCAYL